MRPLAAHCHWGLAKLYHGSANQACLGEHARAAQALFQDMKMTSWLSQMDVERAPGAPPLVYRKDSLRSWLPG